MWMQKDLNRLLLCMFIVFSGACLEEPETLLLDDQEDILIYGQLWGKDGKALENAEVFIEDQAQAIATTDTEGNFTIRIDAQEVVRVKSRIPVQRQGLRLYYQKNLGAAENLVGISAPINLFTSGEVDLGITILDNGFDVEGQVWALPRNQDLEVVSSAMVQIGRWQGFTNEDGRFQIAGLPRGSLPMYVLASGFGPNYSSLLIEPGLVTNELPPVVLFPEFGVSGALILQGDDNAPSQIESVLRPFRKSFRVFHSPQAAWVRMDHRQESFEPGEGLITNEQGVTIPRAKWMKISSLLDYDLPGEGAFNIHYQFANQDQSEISDVFQLPVLMDRFGSEAGIRIEEGQEIVTSSRVNINIDVPDIAVRMRFAETEFELLQRGWVPSVSQMTYDFAPLPDQSGNVRQILVQFQDSFGNMSRVYKASVRMVLFPENSAFITLGNSACVNNCDWNINDILPIKVVLPSNAYEVRIFEETFESPTVTPPPSPTWIQANEDHIYEFQSAGQRNLLIQFRDQNGNRSIVYQKIVNVQP
ncbi:MAG: hypothetical protein ACOH5I_00850 [Oligoflexus sp.]